MGVNVNPGNTGFRRIAGEKYVDKTMLIDLMNQRIDTDDSLVCISRPRRFGKSYAAKMLCAYYDCSCDSHGLFDNKKISGVPSYKEHLNKYNVISLDITSYISDAVSDGIPLIKVPKMIKNKILKELVKLDPSVEDENVNDAIAKYVENTGRKFIFIIDEWDALIREAKKDPETQKSYLNLLRGWFKNNDFTPYNVAAAYMTGILPIKKDGSQSAVSDFKEYTILYPEKFADFTGFSEAEVSELCSVKSLDYDEVKEWYDGYDFPGVGAIYNPYSVMCALESGKCRSYWGKTSAVESLTTYINMNFDGLQEKIARLAAGECLRVDVDSFQNDFETFGNADDVLTLLIHLGYLTYDEDAGTAHIPNKEVCGEFERFLNGKSENIKWAELILRSQKLLKSTLEGDSQTVCSVIEEIRKEEYAPQFYNNEQALRAVIKYAYLSAVGRYMKIEEMPSGKGLADVVYIPYSDSADPALVIELKWNRTSKGAVAQIKNKSYTATLKPFAGNIILVGLNYDEKTGKHSCTIERA